MQTQLFERPGGTLALVEGAVHCPQTEMPEKTRPIVIDFLKRGAST
jgi:hypothetical protein